MIKKDKYNTMEKVQKDIILNNKDLHMFNPLNFASAARWKKHAMWSICHQENSWNAYWDMGSQQLLKNLQKSIK